MMGVRVLCFILMVLVHPYGWYTWVFGVAAIFIPYVAVVLANVGQEGKTVSAVNPERALEAHAAKTTVTEEPGVVRITEGPHAVAAGATAPDAAASDSAAPGAAAPSAAAPGDPE